MTSYEENRNTDSLWPVNTGVAIVDGVIQSYVRQARKSWCVLPWQPLA
jgi:hypothetical protein